ncbi:hypothetical protein HDU85_006846 [Gaertneriomyces sp. JEL0708]|nr:hypothetical protein HDU85_006846 [Gaertneriomyces sp. JEL0708]
MLHAPLPSSGISVPSVPSSPSASGYDCPSPAFSDIPVCMETANKYITMLNSQELEERAAVPEPFTSDKHLLLPSAESISPLPELGSSQETVFDRFVDEATLRTEETGGLLGNINLFGVLLNADTYETGCSDAEMPFELTSSPERKPVRAKAADRIVDMKENSLSKTYEALSDNASGIAFERPLDFSIPMRERLGRNMSDRQEESRKRRTRSLNESEELPRKKTSASRLRSMKNETSDAGKSAAKRPMSGATLPQLDENELLTQVVWKKTASGRYVCPYPNCSKSFERKFNGSTHYATHFDVRKYPCDACERSFTRSYDLKRHQKLHRRNVKGCSKVLDDSD